MDVCSQMHFGGLRNLDVNAFVFGIVRLRRTSVCALNRQQLQQKVDTGMELSLKSEI